ncbi:MAG: DUF1795 domain-containing protein [Methanolinea sp.]|jgi:hypothetical protein|nr:DUF1795 domain-containing protein [Methanolinea sp.]
MDKVKVLLVLLAISLGGNVFLILASSESPVSGAVTQPLLYAYHQAFPPLENTTAEFPVSENMTSGENITASDIGEFTPGKGFSGNDTLLLRELLLQMEEEGTLDEFLITTLMSEEEGNIRMDVESMDTKPEPTPDPDAWKEYSSSRWRFSIPYPPSWEVKEGGTSSNPAVTFTAPPDTKCSAVTTECYQYVASLAISIDQKPETIELEEYFNKKVAKLQQDLAITATSKSAPTIISGNKAYWIEYYTRDSRGNPSKRYMQYFTILDKKVYVLTYSGPYSTAENVYSIHKPDVQKMINAFEVEREYKVV